MRGKPSALLSRALIARKDGFPDPLFGIVHRVGGLALGLMQWGPEPLARFK